MLLHRPAAPTLTALTLAAIAFSAAIYAIMGFVNNGLLPYTILDLEFATTPARLGEMATVWGASGIEAARQSLWLDYAFIPCYVLAFSGLTLIVARAANGAWQRVGLVVLGLPVIAGFFDVVENTLLLGDLPPAGGFGLWVAAVSAGLKFALLAVTLVYILAALARKVFGRP